MKRTLWLLSLLFFMRAEGADLFNTDADKAFALAKKNHIPVLLDFFGIWCPPCNQMNETVFETSAFLEKAKKFVLLKLDVDDKTSWKWKDKYKVGGYPTYVFADWQGNELYRVVGARSPRAFLQVMDMVRTIKDKDIAKACLSNNTEDLWRCAVTCVERDDKACAEKAYHKLEAKLKLGSPRYLLARTYFVEHETNEDLKRSNYEQLLEKYPSSPLALVWDGDYLRCFPSGSDLKPKMALLQKVADNFEAIKKDSQLDEYGLLPTDVAEMHADLLEKLGKLDEAKLAWREVAVQLDQLAKQLPAGSQARGFAIERISCLEAAGDFAAALELANEYRVQFPEEFTFHFWAATVLNHQKKYAESLPVAQKALQYSYGDNKIRAAILMIRTQSALSDKEGARQTYQQVVQEIKPDSQLQIRTHKYLKQLEEAYHRSQT